MRLPWACNRVKVAGQIQNLSLVVPTGACFWFGVSIFPRFIFPVAALLFAFSAQAQELEIQPTPFTALIDFASLEKPVTKLLPKQALPIWLETVQVIHNDADTATKQPATTTFRMRLRQMPGLNDSVFLRLFFEDRPDAHPTVTAWSETGDQKFASEPLGAGLGLPASESMSIPTKGADYIEILVPGNGSSVRKALVASLKKNEVGSAFDFAPAATVVDPFGGAAPATPTQNDLFLFGRVRATLDPGPVKLTNTETETESASVQFAFNLESAPLLAMVTFDILNADPVAPLECWLDRNPLGPIAVQWPDLADPAYAGVVRPLESMRFHYSGWVRCQKIIPGSLLHNGVNTFILQLPSGASPVAIRVVELQLKHNWRQLDYSLAPH